MFSAGRMEVFSGSGLSGMRTYMVSPLSDGFMNKTSCVTFDYLIEVSKDITSQASLSVFLLLSNSSSFWRSHIWTGMQHTKGTTSVNVPVTYSEFQLIFEATIGPPSSTIIAVSNIYLISGTCEKQAHGCW